MDMVRRSAKAGGVRTVTAGGSSHRGRFGARLLTLAAPVILVVAGCGAGGSGGTSSVSAQRLGPRSSVTLGASATGDIVVEGARIAPAQGNPREVFVNLAVRKPGDGEHVPR
jgi:hypothetical protein